MSAQVVQLLGKVCVVTGGTSGIGREIALGLARLGGEIVIIGRDPRRTYRAATELQRASGNLRIDGLDADLSSQRSIHELSDELHRRYQQLHVLVNNAGGLYRTRQLTDEGLERTFALNHLGYFALSISLLDLLLAGAPARIVNIASKAHQFASVDLDDLQSQRRYGGLHAYSASKLENLCFTYELARRLVGTGVTVNAVHPGTTATSLGRGELGWYKLLVTLLQPFLRRPRDGADTAVWLASSPEVEGVTGGYFVDRHRRASSAESYDRELQRRLWDVSAELTRAT
jgi:NAD(P)-dependent dehydrogenase (short-subunit alcohol dehydrogenase family)